MAAKVILVTGASRGIGLAVAKYLLGESHSVVLVSRSEDALAKVKKEYPKQAEYLAGDVTKNEVVEAAVNLAVKAFGRLDGIVINHGVLAPMARIADVKIDDWRQIYEANIFSAVALSKAAIPLLRKTKGRIIFTSSGAALGGYASWGAYGSSKAALNSLAQHLAVEEPDIVTVSVGPGRVDTDMQRDLRVQGKPTMAEADYASFVTAHEGGQLLQPELPGHVIARLSLDATSELSGKYLKYVFPSGRTLGLTGRKLTVTGGTALRWQRIRTSEICFDVSHAFSGSIGNGGVNRQTECDQSKDEKSRVSTRVIRH